MSIIFEEGIGFGRNPSYYQQLAREYFIGEKFDSVQEALDQRDGNGKTLSSYFSIRSKTIKPEELPTIIYEAEIGVILRDEEGVILHNQPETALPILTASVVY